MGNCVQTRGQDVQCTWNERRESSHSFNTLYLSLYAAWLQWQTLNEFHKQSSSFALKKITTKENEIQLCVWVWWCREVDTLTIQTTKVIIKLVFSIDMQRYLITITENSYVFTQINKKYTNWNAHPQCTLPRHVWKAYKIHPHKVSLSRQLKIFHFHTGQVTTNRKETDLFLLTNYILSNKDQKPTFFYKYGFSINPCLNQTHHSCVQLKQC